MLITLILAPISQHVKGLLSYRINISYQVTGSRSCDLSYSRNGVTTLLGKNVHSAYLSFQTVGNFSYISYITLRTKEELMLKHYSHWCERLLSEPYSSNTIFSCC